MTTHPGVPPPLPPAGADTNVPPAPETVPPESVLCSHCGRTASNGISCQGICVADSGY
jgi:hypothetical protein